MAKSPGKNTEKNEKSHEKHIEQLKMDRNSESVKQVDENDNLEVQKLYHSPIKMKAIKNPSSEVMVEKAITHLNERFGSSVAAIMKYIVANYAGINEQRTRFYVYKYIKKAVSEGKIKQNKQKFKLIPTKAATTTTKKSEKKLTTKKTISKATVNHDEMPSTSQEALKKTKIKPKLTADPLKTKKTENKSTKKVQKGKQAEKTKVSNPDADAGNETTKLAKQKKPLKKGKGNLPRLSIGGGLSLVKKKSKAKKTQDKVNTTGSATTMQPTKKRAVKKTKKAHDDGTPTTSKK